MPSYQFEFPADLAKQTIEEATAIWSEIGEPDEAQAQLLKDLNASVIASFRTFLQREHDRKASLSSNVIKYTSEIRVLSKQLARPMPEVCGFENDADVFQLLVDESNSLIEQVKALEGTLGKLRNVRLSRD